MFTKRLFDLIIVGLSAPVWLPLLVIIAALVRLNLGAPVLFRQKRPGRGEAIFELMKFRTMREGRDAQGHPLPDGDRLTAFGRWLRSTSLDELPELMNVLQGEMSLVGPRPLLVQYLARYSTEQRRRHLAQPGLTGWAQINGRNCISWEERFKLDLWYVDNRTVWLDFKILWHTAIRVLQRRDITAAGSSTMPEFGVGTNEQEK